MNIHKKSVIVQSNGFIGPEGTLAGGGGVLSIH